MRGRRLLVDVSLYCETDAKTGIQRVIRELLPRLQTHADEGVVITPVHAVLRGGYRAAQWSGESSVSPPDLADPQMLSQPGDVFLGLDLVVRRLPNSDGQISAWKASGTQIAIFVHDLLPLENWRWFTWRSNFHFRRWWRWTLRNADALICMSQHVAEQCRQRIKRASPQIVRVPMGSPRASFPVPQIQSPVAEWAHAKPTLLMVGTVEPRKGYDCIIAALEEARRSGLVLPFQLAVVGKPGWKSAALQRRMEALALHCTGFRWLCDVDDAVLDELYRTSIGLVFASYGEGCGLPLLEALRYRRPALVRDLPVFHETAHPAISYFTDDSPQALLTELTNFSLAASTIPLTRFEHPLPDWDDTARAILSQFGMLSPAN